MTTKVVMIKNITRFIPTSQRRKIKYEATIEPKCDSTCFFRAFSNSLDGLLADSLWAMVLAIDSIAYRQWFIVWFKLYNKIDS